jgi:hypothetical protein
MVGVARGEVLKQVGTVWVRSGGFVQVEMTVQEMKKPP